jgi:hypothetical protein
MSTCTTKNIVLNPHTDEIDKIIDKIKKSGKDQWEIVFSPNTTDDQLVDFLSIGFFTNLVQTSFRDRYMQRFPCHDCGGNSTQRCHGHNEARPVLIRRALKVVRRNPKFGGSIPLRELAIQFFEEHKPTKFTFKCYSCHKKEPANDDAIARREITKARQEANMKAKMLEKEGKLKARILEKEGKLKARMLEKENAEIQKLSKKMASAVTRFAKENNKKTAKLSKTTRTYTKESK